MPSLLKTVLSHALGVAALCSGSKAQNLIPNPGFESGTGPLCSNRGGQQGVLPSPWVQGGLATDGADTYSSNCQVLPGATASWGNFQPFLANSGVRWAAAWNATPQPYPVERLACPLPVLPLPNTSYLVVASFMPSSRHTGTTGYDFLLSQGPSPTGGTILCRALGAGTPAGIWTEHSAIVQTPPTVPNPAYLVLDPVLGSSSYMGVDDLVMVQLGSSYQYFQSNLSGPTLSVVGMISPGAPFSVVLTSGHPQQMCLVVVGLTPLAYPLLGQMLLVSPLTTVMAVTNASGAFTFNLRWPSGLPSGTRIFFQALAATAPATIVASNGVAVVGS